MTMARFCGLVLLGVVALPVSAVGVAGPGRAPPEDAKARLEIGKELFTREWLPNDKRSFAGDGLGPVHNARSCVACHNQGGVGGAGAKANNLILIGAFIDLSTQHISLGVSVPPPDANSPVDQPNRDSMAKFHPALRTESFFVLHRLGTSMEYREWKKDHDLESPEQRQYSSKIGNLEIRFIPTERNSPALFGAGLIERIPDSALELIVKEQEANASKFDASPGFWARIGSTLGLAGETTRPPLPVTGRISRLQGGKVGKFGWKADVSSLFEFTLQACATEIGLEVPGLHRAQPPWIPDYRAPGLDLSAEQCNSLTEFVRSLPRPFRKRPETRRDAIELLAGQKLFGKLGCSECHRPTLGNVEEIYSDLLLHDMGSTLSGSGFYRTNIEFVKGQGKAEAIPIARDAEGKAQREKPPEFGASTREWRTPPLWGLRDSRPYLHDGRADTIEDAIKMHDGEGAVAAGAFERLSTREKTDLGQFLKSLAAPTGQTPRR